MKKLFFLSIIIILSTSATFSQSQYLQKGESAVEIGFGYQATEGIASDIGYFSIGFGSHGRGNVNFLIGRVDEITIFAPGIDIYFIKQNIRRNIPLSFGLNLQSTIARGHYQISTSFTGGGFINRDFKFSKNAGITPFISVGYSESDVWKGRSTGAGFTIYIRGDNISSLKTEYYVTELHNALVLSLSITII